MDDGATFGRWLKRRRKALDMTQCDLARRVGCAIVTIKKIEADQRRPSAQIAERLAEYLEITPDERAAFMRFARIEAHDGRPALPPPIVAAPAAHAPRRRGSSVPVPLTPLIGRDQDDHLVTLSLVTRHSSLVTRHLVTLSRWLLTPGS